MAKRQSNSNPAEDDVTPMDISEYVASIIGLKFDLNFRTIYLMGAIDDEVAERFIIVLNFFDSISDDLIRVVLSSPGGEEEAGYAIYDAIRLCGSKVTIDGLGMVASMAAVIMQAADQRRLSENAFFMVHHGSMGLPDHIEQDKVHAISKQIEKNNTRYHNLLADRTGLSVESIRKMSEAETYMTSEEALALGFIDKVWLPKKKFRGGK